MKTRRIIISALALGLMNFAPLARAEVLVQANPSSAPTVVAVPAAVPAQPSDAKANNSGSVNVVVLPFQLISNENVHTWIGLALQQALASQIAQNQAFHSITVNNAPASLDVDVAATVAKQANAALVVFGNYQVVDTNLRVTGYMMDVASGRILKVLQATGPIRSLFTLEDQLDEQLVRGLNQQFPTLAVKPSPAEAPASAQPVAVALASTPAPQAAPNPIFSRNTLPPVLYISPQNIDTTPNYQASAPANDASPVYSADTFYSNMADSGYPGYSYPYIYPSFGSFGFGRGFHHGSHFFGSTHGAFILLP